MHKTIKDLSNDEYHHGGKYTEWVSSSQLKKYLISPKAAKYALDHPDTSQTDSMRLGSLFHSLMEQCTKHYDNGTKAYTEWLRGIAVFEPPVKDDGKTWGSTSKAYKEAYEEFLQTNKGKVICAETEIAQIQAMCASLISGDGNTSEQVRKLLRMAKESEVSIFYETEDGIKLKIRPDMLTRSILVDWKSTSLETLDDESIAKAIIKYGYHISMAMYQYVLHEISGKWYVPYLVFVQTKEPYDAVVADLSEWCYQHDKDLDLTSMGVGALEFKRLLDLHTKCIKENKWPGAEHAIPAENNSIMKPAVPTWYGMKILN